MAYLDFPKAFDVVSQEVLIDRIACLGFSAQIVGWIGGFLLDRCMSVSVCRFFAVGQFAVKKKG